MINHTITISKNRLVRLCSVQIIVKYLKTITNYHFIQETASTCCLIKPHAIARAGAIIEVLNIMFSLLQQHSILGAGDLMCCNKNYPVLKVLQEEGFRLFGLATYLLTFHQAEELLEVYRLHNWEEGF